MIPFEPDRLWCASHCCWPCILYLIWFYNQAHGLVKVCNNSPIEFDLKKIDLDHAYLNGVPPSQNNQMKFYVVRIGNKTEQSPNKIEEQTGRDGPLITPPPPDWTDLDWNANHSEEMWGHLYGFLLLKTIGMVMTMTTRMTITVRMTRTTTMTKTATSRRRTTLAHQQRIIKMQTQPGDGQPGDDQDGWGRCRYG